MVRKKGGSSKTPASSGVDDSYIVFSNAKDNSKAKNVESKGSSSKPGLSKEAGQISQTKPQSKDNSSKTGASQAKPDEAPKKPSVKTLIGGPSWTGPLPVTVFNKHCIVKKGWETPEYTMVGSEFVVELRILTWETEQNRGRFLLHCHS